MIADYLRILSPLLKFGRPKGIDPLLYTFMLLGKATKSATYYAGVSVEYERERLSNALAALDKLRKKETRSEAGVSTAEMKIPGHYGDIPLKLYSIADPEELVVFLHSGGWSTGSIATEDYLCERLSGALNVAVVSVDYHIAPDYRYPAGLEDTVSTIQWAINMAPSLGIPSSKVTVAGTSSGANLAAAACLQRRDNRLALPARQLLIYPVTDVTTLDTESYREYGRKKLGLSAAQMDWFRRNYVIDEDSYADPYVSINRAEDLSSLPPALIITAEFDILRSEAEVFADRLAAAGTKVETMKADGMAHGFLIFLGLLDSINVWFDRIVQAYRCFRDGGSGKDH